MLIDSNKLKKWIGNMLLRSNQFKESFPAKKKLFEGKIEALQETLNYLDLLEAYTKTRESVEKIKDN